MADGFMREPEFAEGATVLEPTPARRVVTQPADWPRMRRFSPPEDMPFLTSRDTLRVTNEDKKVVTLMWDGSIWDIPPGELAIVPFPAVVNALGDPRSMKGEMLRFTDGRGNRGMIPERYDEIRRLFALYGVRNENLDDTSAEAHEKATRKMTEACGLVQRAPKLLVQTQKGMKVIFPAEIPDHLPYPVKEPENRAGVVDQRRAIDRMQAENQELAERLAQVEQLLNERLGGPSVDPGPRRPE